MDDGVELVCREVEEPVGFDEFEGFVHEGCRVDGDFFAHGPGGVVEGLVDGGVLDLLEGLRSEGASGGGEGDAADGVGCGGWGCIILGGECEEALPEGGVFGVDGEDF